MEEIHKMSIEIPQVLVTHLSGLGPHFCLVEKRGKNPDIGGKEWQKHPLEPDDLYLQDWLKQGGNYGVIGGWGLVIVDLDLDELKAIVKEKLPRTFTVQSPGSQGWHLYYVSSIEKPIRLRDKDGENVGDIQGQGKMIVGPGSVHPNGGIYKIVDDGPLAQVTREQIIESFKEYVVADREIDIIDATARAERKESKIDLDILQVVPLSGLHRIGNEYYGPHPSHGSKTGKNFHVNPSKNVWHCFRHGTGGGPFLWLAVEEGIIDCSEAGPGALRGEVFIKVLEKARERGLIREIREKTKLEKNVDEGPAQYFTEEGKFIPGWLGEDIKKDFRFATMRDNEDLYVYKDGIYQREAEVLIKEEARRRLTNDLARVIHINETVAHIKETSYVDRNKFNNPHNLIAAKNGLLDVLTGVLQPHTPEKMITTKIPVTYNKDAACPNIMKFLSEIHHKEDIPIIQEIVGYCLLKNYPFAKAFMLLGSGRNGKSTELNLIEALLGEENVATPSLQDLLYNRFAKSELYDKLANIHADIPPTKLERTGPFKMLTGSDTLYMERKYGQPFYAKNHAKLVYSANELPETMDLTRAFFERWILIKFPHTFPEDDPNTDPHTLKKLTPPEELSGFLNWALEGLHRLLKQGHFTRTTTREAVENEWIMKTDSLRAFGTKMVKVKLGSFTTKKEFYEQYQEFCVENDLEVVTMSEVGRRLPTIIPQTGEFRPLVDGKQQKAWKDIIVVSSPDSPDVNKNLLANMDKNANMDKKAVYSPDSTEVDQTIPVVEREKVEEEKEKVEEKVVVYKRGCEKNGAIGAISVTKITSKLKSIIQLDKPYEGNCGACGNNRTLYWCLTFLDGSWGDACEDCAQEIMEKSRSED